MAPATRMMIVAVADRDLDRTIELIGTPGPSGAVRSSATPTLRPLSIDAYPIAALGAPVPHSRWYIWRPTAPPLRTVVHRTCCGRHPNLHEGWDDLVVRTRTDLVGTDPRGGGTGTWGIGSTLHRVVALSS